MFANDLSATVSYQKGMGNFIIFINLYLDPSWVQKELIKIIFNPDAPILKSTDDSVYIQTKQAEWILLIMNKLF